MRPSAALLRPPLVGLRHRATYASEDRAESWKPPPGFVDMEADDSFDGGSFDDDERPYPMKGANRELAEGPPKRASSALEALLEMPRSMCSGCGARFQAEDEEAPGFVPGSVLEERSAKVTEDGNKVARKTPLCQRCHGLRYQNRLPQDALRVGTGAAVHKELQPEHFLRLLRDIATRRCVVVAIVDLFDFHGSLVPDLASVVGSNELILVANKERARPPMPVPMPVPMAYDHGI